MGNKEQGARSINILFWAEIIQIIISFAWGFYFITSLYGQLSVQPDVSQLSLRGYYLSALLIELPSILTMVGLTRLARIYGYEFRRASLFLILSLIASVGIAGLYFVFDLDLNTSLQLIVSLLNMLAYFYTLNSMSALSAAMEEPYLAKQFKKCMHIIMICITASAVLSLFNTDTLDTLVSLVTTIGYIYMLQLYRRLRKWVLIYNPGPAIDELLEKSENGDAQNGNPDE